MSLLYFEYMKKKILRVDPNISLYDLDAMTREELENHLRMMTLPSKITYGVESER